MAGGYGKMRKKPNPKKKPAKKRAYPKKKK